MRTIRRASRFKRDLKRETGGLYRSILATVLPETLNLLINDQPLPPSALDHSLTGDWEGYRDCHLKPDLVLIYRKLGTDELQLARLGSHSELRL
jgi:mRNA interferase YafQ